MDQRQDLTDAAILMRLRRLAKRDGLRFRRPNNSRDRLARYGAWYLLDKRGHIPSHATPGQKATLRKIGEWFTERQRQAGVDPAKWIIRPDE